MARISRIVLVFLSFALIGYGWYDSQIAQEAAVANLLELSVALQSLSVSTLALVIPILATVTNEEWKRADDLRLEQRIFDSMKSAADPIILRGLIRIKMRLRKTISLQRTYNKKAQRSSPRRNY